MKLFIVPSPIGNLEDMTFRAVRILKEADLILCEDTRTSSVLLRHYGILRPLAPFHRNNEHQVLSSLVRQIQAGKTIALLSDAGTPGISDPGFLLVRACIQASLPVECLPGASALIPALVDSGLPIHRFAFEGFLPLKKGRSTLLRELALEERTLVFYESPRRLLRTLEDLATHMGGERPCCICRELTKVFEEQVRGSLRELGDHFRNKGVKGEFVVLVAGRET